MLPWKNILLYKYILSGLKMDSDIFFPFTFNRFLWKLGLGVWPFHDAINKCFVLSFGLIIIFQDKLVPLEIKIF